MTEYKRVFLDTAPLIYFLDNDERYGGTVKAIFEEILAGGGIIESSVITCEEYLFIRIEREMSKKYRHL